MDFGLTFDKVIVIAVIAVVIVGPTRLPQYARRLAQLVQTLRELADGAKSRVAEELGPEFNEVDWAQLDPRRYDPRRIIKDALSSGEPVLDLTETASKTKET